jgi:hypothetical protein
MVTFLTWSSPPQEISKRGERMYNEGDAITPN